MSKKQLNQFGLIKSIDTEKRTATFIFSDGDLDRHGTSLNPKGWQTENYMKNPVILFGHNYRDLPVGKTIKLWVEKGKQLMGEVEFASHQFAQDVFQLIVDGFLNATSVGFIPLKLDEDGKYTWSEMELLEVSVVPVPANPRALSKKELGIFKSIEAQTGLELLLKEVKAEQEESEEDEPAEEPEKPEEEEKETDKPEKKEGDESEEADEPAEGDEPDEPAEEPGDEPEPTEEEKRLTLIVTKAVKAGIKEFIEKRDSSEVARLTQENAQQKEVLTALRDHLKSGDKSMGKGLQLLKKAVDEQ